MGEIRPKFIRFDNNDLTSIGGTPLTATSTSPFASGVANLFGLGYKFPYATSERTYVLSNGNFLQA